MKRIQAGTTKEFYWVNSGVIPTSIVFNLLDGTDTLVESATMVSSGMGFFYYNHTVPSSAGFWVGQITAIIATKPYINRIPFKTILGEVD